MEQYSHGLFSAWSQREDVTLLANPAGNGSLPRFFLRALGDVLRRARQFDLIYLGDGVLSALIPFIRARSRARIGITVHGLDITYQRFGFQWLFPPLIASADTVVCVSSHTRNAAQLRGVPEAKLRVIPNGLDVSALCTNQHHTRQSIEQRHGFSLDGEILFSVGRLVKRKGHAWFVRNYLPRLSERFTLVIAGIGPESEAIRAISCDLGVSERVRLIGSIDDQEKAFWLSCARGYVMPNIQVPNDPEGFGISVLEAVAFGLPVFTTGIEGIADQMRYCHALDRLLELPLPQPTPAETEALRVQIDWDRVVEAYVREV